MDLIIEVKTEYGDIIRTISIPNCKVFPSVGDKIYFHDGEMDTDGDKIYRHLPIFERRFFYEREEIYVVVIKEKK